MTLRTGAGEATAGVVASAPHANGSAASSSATSVASGGAAPADVSATALAAADALCLDLASRHYENFTVAAAFLPLPVRCHLSRIYAYCRTTDDLGDETGREAPAALRRWRAEVEDALLRGMTPSHPVLLAVARTAAELRIPPQPFLDLIAANEQDQVVRRYRTWTELEAYCRLSAAPVGRMVLRVFGVEGERAQRLSDDVCIGLQLANFAQDVTIDTARGRRYVVDEDVDAIGLQGAIRLLCARAEHLLGSGRALEAMVPGRLRLQLALYRRGGLAIIAAVRRNGYRTDLRRPRVGTVTKLGLALSAVPDAARSSLASSPTDPAMAAAERWCSDMARRQAANFYWGFVALPRPQRTAVYALYDFARQVDDAADEPGDGDPRTLVERQRRRLRHAVGTDGAALDDDPVLRVLVPAMRRCGIPAAELELLIDGVTRDITTTRYATWEELRGYCALVASSIGRMCVRIWGYSDEAVFAHADDLGVAMQLTNILRDVREDAALGRIYLPAEELRDFGVSEQDVLCGRPTPQWEALVRHQVQRATALFQSGLTVTEYVPRRAGVCVRTMAGIYRTVLQEIERQPRLPLQQRVSLSAPRKALVLLRSCA